MSEMLEGRWDCKACSSKGVLGRHEICPGCGSARGPDVEFYLPDENQAPITDSALLQQAHAGPEWYCEHCQRANTDLRQHCDSCGAPRGSSAKHDVAKDVINDTPTAQKKTKGFRYVAEPTPTVTTPNFSNNDPPISFGEPSRFAIGCVLVIFGLLLFGLIFFLSLPNISKLRVTSHSWQRSVDIEHYVTLTQEDWTIPIGGREIDRTSRVHHTVAVIDHYDEKAREVRVRTGTRTVNKTRTVTVKTGTKSVKTGTKTVSKGNGFFEKQDVYKDEPIYETRTECYTEDEPVYGTKIEYYQDPVYRDDPIYRIWYKYAIDRWVFERTETCGNQSIYAVWPTLNLKRLDNNSWHVGDERVLKQSETYTLSLIDDKGKTYTYNLNEPEWRSFQDQETVTANIGVFGGVSDLKKLGAER